MRDITQSIAINAVWHVLPSRSLGHSHYQQLRFLQATNRNVNCTPHGKKVSPADITQRRVYSILKNRLEGGDRYLAPLSDLLVITGLERFAVQISFCQGLKRKCLFARTRNLPYLSQEINVLSDSVCACLSDQTIPQSGIVKGPSCTLSLIVSMRRRK